MGKRNWNALFKNYGLWLAIGSFAILTLQTFVVDIDLGKYERLYEAFLSILVTAGISKPVPWPRLLR
jgi:hypothetical protein